MSEVDENLATNHGVSTREVGRMGREEVERRAELKPSDTMSLVWRKAELQAEELDIRAFQELSFEAKHSVIREHEVLWKRDGFRLGEFLHTYRKLWNDTSKARGVA